MIHHPEHRRPPYLTSLGLFDPAVLDARLTFESEYQITPPIGSPHGPPESIENIRTRISDSGESEQKDYDYRYDGLYRFLSHHYVLQHLIIAHDIYRSVLIILGQLAETIATGDRKLIRKLVINISFCPVAKNKCMTILNVFALFNIFNYAKEHLLEELCTDYNTSNFSSQ